MLLDRRTMSRRQQADQIISGMKRLPTAPEYDLNINFDNQHPQAVISKIILRGVVLGNHLLHVTMPDFQKYQLVKNAIPSPYIYQDLGNLNGLISNGYAICLQTTDRWLIGFLLERIMPLSLGLDSFKQELVNQQFPTGFYGDLLPLPTWYASKKLEADGLVKFHLTNTLPLSKIRHINFTNKSNGSSMLNVTPSDREAFNALEASLLAEHLIVPVANRYVLISPTLSLEVEHADRQKIEQYLSILNTFEPMTSGGVLDDIKTLAMGRAESSDRVRLHRPSRNLNLQLYDLDLEQLSQQAHRDLGNQRAPRPQRNVFMAGTQRSVIEFYPQARSADQIISDLEQRRQNRRPLDVAFNVDDPNSTIRHIHVYGNYVGIEYYRVLVKARSLEKLREIQSVFGRLVIGKEQIISAINVYELSLETEDLRLLKFFIHMMISITPELLNMSSSLDSQGLSLGGGYAALSEVPQWHRAANYSNDGAITVNLFNTDANSKIRRILLIANHSGRNRGDTSIDVSMVNEVNQRQLSSGLSGEGIRAWGFNSSIDFNVHRSRNSLNAFMDIVTRFEPQLNHVFVQEVRVLAAHVSQLTPVPAVNHHRDHRIESQDLMPFANASNRLWPPALNHDVRMRDVNENSDDDLQVAERLSFDEHYGHTSSSYLPSRAAPSANTVEEDDIELDAYAEKRKKDHWICPITQLVMKHPVWLKGHTGHARFEESALRQYFRQKKENPLTRAYADASQIRPDLELKSIIDTHREVAKAIKKATTIKK